jgi:hypothetical protein
MGRIIQKNCVRLVRESREAEIRAGLRERRRAGIHGTITRNILVSDVTGMPNRLKIPGMVDGGYEEDRGTTARFAAKLRESAGKEGVYYIVRFPTRWRLYAFAWEDFGDLWHGDVWRRYVVEDLAEAWAPQLAITAEQLKPLWKGFPRGRIERAGIRAYTVYYADDFAETGIAAGRIESAFELGNSSVTWSLDPHEEQNPEHQAALRRLLQI